MKEHGYDFSNVVVLIPAYNVGDIIDNVIFRLNQIYTNLAIVVVNDCSNDNTEENLKKYDIKILSHENNKGQWAALKTGFKYICEQQKYSYLITLDADGQHFPEDIPHLLSVIKNDEADVVIGSRFLNNNPKMLKYRFFGIKLFNFLLYLKTGIYLSDCTSGFRIVKIDSVKNIFYNLKENQYGALEFLIHCIRNNLVIKEVPIKTTFNSFSSKGSIKYAYNLLRIILTS